jgi:hypothetical protein
MSDTADAIHKLHLHATSALKRARQLPVGSDRNDLRQLAKNLRFLAMTYNQNHYASDQDHMHIERRHDHAPIHFS